ncbi:MAG: hypothetical protein JXB05_18610, partial [Myxococcaceae bacterium]|nr:hypothetical protein [Myxococcaceae bacterium]
MAKPLAQSQAAPTAARGRAAQADGFTAARAAPMQLNPEAAPVKEVLPLPPAETGPGVSDAVLEKAVNDAFAQQFNGRSPPSADEMHRWKWKARELIEQHGTEHLTERLFSELNKQVSSGSRIPGATV